MDEDVIEMIHLEQEKNEKLDHLPSKEHLMFGIAPVWAMGKHSNIVAAIER